MNETRGNTRTKPTNFDNPKTIEDYRQILKYYYGLPENMRGPLKEREINSLKDTEKTNKLVTKVKRIRKMKNSYTKGIKKPINNKDLYFPILDQIAWTKPPKIIYYELRVWRNHNIISMHVFTTLKKAMNYYKKHNFSIKEEENYCFVEIVKIDNLNPKYK